MILEKASFNEIKISEIMSSEYILYNVEEGNV